MLINVKMPTIVGILTLMSRINFVLSWVEHEKSFITSSQFSLHWVWLFKTISLLAVTFSHLLIIFIYSLYPDQDRRNGVGPRSVQIFFKLIILPLLLLSISNKVWIYTKYLSKKVHMAWTYAKITDHRPTQCTPRKKHRTPIATWQQQHKVKQPPLSSASWMTTSTALQNKDQTHNPHKTMGATINSESTTTEPPP